MTTSLISLKPSCQTRILCKGYPSASQRIFRLEDFMCPDFLESHIFASAETVIDQSIHIGAQNLLDLIDKTNQTFSKIKQQLDILQDLFITNLASLSSSNEEESGTLQYAMQKLHQKLRENDSDVMLLDEFARLLRRYDQVERKKNDQSDRTQVNISGAMMVLDSIAEDLTASIDGKLSALASWDLNPAQDVIKTYEDYRCKTQLVSNQYCKQVKVSKGTIVNLKDKKYFLFPGHTYEMPVGQTSENGTLRMINLQNGKLLSSTKTRFADTPATTDFPPKIRYMKSLNLIIALSNNKDSLNIYRMFHNKTKKIRRVRISDLCLEMRSSDIRGLEIMEPQNTFAVFGSKTVALVGILTGKVIKSYEFKSNIIGVRYIPDLKFVIVTTESGLKVFDVSSQLKLYKAKFTEHYLTRCVGDFVNIHYSGNMILLVYGMYDDHFLGSCENTFYLFQISHEGVKEYDVDRYEYVTGRSFKQLLPFTENYAININPKSKMVQFIFDCERWRTFSSQKSKKEELQLQIPFKEKPNLKADAKENIILEPMNSLVYCQGRLYMNTYFAAEEQAGDTEDEE